MSKRIAFLSPCLTITGPTVAIYDYADCNESMLHNKSFIFTRTYKNVINEVDTKPEVYDTFQERFTMIYYETVEDIDRMVSENRIDILYAMTKTGSEWEDLVLTTSSCKLCIHCLDNLTTPFGDVFAVIGPAVNQVYGTQFPIVPPMIRIDDSTDNLREQLGIDPSALVFGRYGAYDGFDIPFVHEYIDECKDPNIIFIFMNTKPFTANPRVIYLNGNVDMRVKRYFMNTCDALLHAHERGEMFGLTCGEFAFAERHVITYAHPTATTHLQLLGNRAITYQHKIELDYILSNFSTLRHAYSTKISTNLYRKALIPQNVMRMFKQTFIDEKEEYTLS